MTRSRISSPVVPPCRIRSRSVRYRSPRCCLRVTTPSSAAATLASISAIAFKVSFSIVHSPHTVALSHYTAWSDYRHNTQRGRCRVVCFWSGRRNRSRIISSPSLGNFRDPGSHPRLMTRGPLRLSIPDAKRHSLFAAPLDHFGHAYSPTGELRDPASAPIASGLAKAHSAFSLSGRRESNPVFTNPNRTYYRYTTARHGTSPVCRILELARTSRAAGGGGGGAAHPACKM